MISDETIKKIDKSIERKNIINLLKSINELRSEYNKLLKKYAEKYEGEEFDGTNCEDYY